MYEAVKTYKNKIGDENVVFSMHYNFVSAGKKENSTWKISYANLPGDPRKLIDMKINRVENIYAVDVYHENKNIGLAHVKVEFVALKW